jgi:competence protein ComEA
LKGIGKKTAEKIILYRKYNKFKKLEDLMKVKGIGPKKFEKIKVRISL